MVDKEDVNNGRTARTTALVAAMLAIMLVGVPSFLSDPVSLSMIGNVAAQSDPEDRKFIIGVEGELGVSTLNPNTYTMMIEAMLIFPCYSGLLQYDMDSQLIGDVAYSWNSTPDMLTWYFELYPEVYFCDPANPYNTDHQLTAEDVIWSYDMYQTNLLSRLHPSLPAIDGEPLISDMGLVDGDPLRMYMELSSPYAPFLGAMSLPILPKYYWESEDPQRFLDDEVPIGSGPFFYNNTGPPSAGTAELNRNPIWHCEQWNGWQNHIDVVILEEQLNEGTAWQALQAGEIDVQLSFDAATYTTTLFETDHVTGFAQSQGFVYEFNLNQLTDEMRSEIGGTFNSGSNDQTLLNKDVREAFAMCIDKQEFIDEVAQGLGTISTSLVPDVNPWVYEYGSTPGEELFVFDTAAARQKLMDAGWAYDELGGDAGPDTIPLCLEGGVDPLRFDFISPDGDEWKAACAQIVTWVAEAGIVLDYTPKSISQMNTAWYGANYDVWLWDWIFGPLNDPSTDCLCVLTTDAIGVDSDIYWSNATFDALYNESLVTMDPALRYEIVADMQRLVYEEAACQSLAYRQDLYGVSTQNWMNFGDWNSTYMLLPDNTLQYSGMLMSPTDNEAPQFTGISSNIVGQVGVPISIQADVLDDDLTTPLDMRWYWGDLDRSAWVDDIGTGSGTDSMEHTYDQDGQYTAYVAVREGGPSNGILDEFITWKEVKVTIYDYTNDAPVVDSLTFTHALEPADPDTGTTISFSCVASDDEGDDLFISWDFGDGLIGSGTDTSHQYLEPGPYEFTISVTDNHLGTGDRPVVENGEIYVGENGQPSISVPSFVNKVARTEYTYTVDASDPDAHDVLTYTWFWGDGSTDVTSVPEADHSYWTWGEYTLTVYVDDNTGVPGHNVSDTNSVDVASSSSNSEPVIQGFDVETPSPYYTFQEIVFSASAIDADGEDLRFTFEFDGGYEVVDLPSSTPNELLECEASFEYLTSGSKSVYLHVSDGIANVSMGPLVIEIEANDVPMVSLPEVYASTDVSQSFTVIANDDDPLTFTWEWGDDTVTVTTTDTTTHTYAESGDYVYRVWADDDHGHNATVANYAYVNAIPVLEDLAPRDAEAGEEITFVATATDADPGDVLTYLWMFGDGDELMTTSPSVTHVYSTEGDYTRTVHVWDGFEIYLPSHNVSSSAPVTVTPVGVNVAPEIDWLDDVSGTVGEVMVFAATITDGNNDPLTITWDFGDGEFEYEAAMTVSHIYTSDGLFEVVVWADDGEYNESRLFNVTISVDAVPTAVANVPSSADEDTIVEFDGSGSYDDIMPLADWEWYIVELDETLTGEIVICDSFVDPGEYTVDLTVTDSVDQTDTTSVIITILDVTDPVAVADASPSEVDMGDTVSLIGTDSADSYSTIVSYEWSFYDGVESQALTGGTVDHVFEVAGSYPVTLTVEDAAGNQAEDTVTIVVRDTESPVADAGDDQTVTEGATVTFDGSGTDNVAVVSYMWTFDYDGSEETLTGTTPTFDFEIPDVYVVMLTVADEAGNTGSDTVTITVEVAPVVNEPPVADAGTAQTVTVGDEVTFDGSGSSDSDGTIDNYTWLFTYDAAPEEVYGETATFTFDIVGTYPVTLTVTDDDGDIDTAEMTVTVEDVVPPTNDPPVADAGTAQTVTVGDEVTFAGSGSTDSDGTIADYTWTFTYDGETETLNGVSPVFTFEIAGAYTVTLTVTDDDGDTDTDTVTITVEEEDDPIDDDKKSFLESYGLPIGIALALIVAALVAFFVMKGRKGGKPEAEELESMSAGEPEELGSTSAGEPRPPQDQS